jgi:hypothetical protein
MTIVSDWIIDHSNDESQIDELAKKAEQWILSPDEQKQLAKLIKWSNNAVITKWVIEQPMEDTINQQFKEDIDDILTVDLSNYPQSVVKRIKDSYKEWEEESLLEKDLIILSKIKIINDDKFGRITEYPDWKRFLIMKKITDTEWVIHNTYKWPTKMFHQKSSIGEMFSSAEGSLDQEIFKRELNANGLKLFQNSDEFKKFLNANVPWKTEQDKLNNFIELAWFNKSAINNWITVCNVVYGSDYCLVSSNDQISFDKYETSSCRLVYWFQNSNDKRSITSEKLEDFGRNINWKDSNKYMITEDNWHNKYAGVYMNIPGRSLDRFVVVGKDYLYFQVAPQDRCTMWWLMSGCKDCKNKMEYVEEKLREKWIYWDGKCRTLDPGMGSNYRPDYRFWNFAIEKGWYIIIPRENINKDPQEEIIEKIFS